MSRVPKNVQETLARNLELEQARAYSREISKGRAQAEWYSRDFQKLTTLSNGGTLSRRTQELKKTGVDTGIVAIKAARQARLKELFEREALQYEAELNGRGLSLVKPRD
mmetsp:Transcript_10495/g.22525  ORF Transcript_10495/g.22525 Transcript_10495/m.22525 type:complete len:109 (+) Transcript_10495:250-576(+)